ncbi:MAG: dTDP-glucose 4,6-dehydratase [Pirellulaceae bacterium]|nr:dTDP-glucose 4,6-dehydratase [Pirellulaceae bacterium]
MKTLLVTGGSGFIGSSFLRQLFGYGEIGFPHEFLTEKLPAAYQKSPIREAYATKRLQVVNLDNLTYAGSRDSLAAIEKNVNYEFVKGDINNEDLVRDLLEKHKPSAVVHFAAESHVDRSITSPMNFVQTNVSGTCHLLEAVTTYWHDLKLGDRQSFRFLNVSTDEVYGSLPYPTMAHEGMAYNPSSPYSASKGAADHFVSAYYKTYGLPTVTSISVNNYGPYQFPEKLLPLAIDMAAKNQPIPIYGNGKQVRQWTYVEDNCLALWHLLLAGNPGESYHISGGNEVTNLELIEQLCKLIDKISSDRTKPARELIQFVKDRPGHDERYSLECLKLANHFGWSPKITLEDGLEKTVRWYLENLDWSHNCHFRDGNFESYYHS